MDLMTKGWLLIGGGIIIRYIIARRKFNRRGLGGLQHFRSFERGVVTTFFEWVLRWGAVAMMAYGVLCLLAGISRRDKEREQAMQQKEQVQQKPPVN
jgi:hypothetical protein